MPHFTRHVYRYQCDQLCMTNVIMKLWNGVNMSLKRSRCYHSNYKSKFIYYRTWYSPASNPTFQEKRKPDGKLSDHINVIIGVWEILFHEMKKTANSNIAHFRFFLMFCFYYFCGWYSIMYKYIIYFTTNSDALCPSLSKETFIWPTNTHSETLKTWQSLWKLFILG